MSAEERMTVRLTGGGPWGFRLQGGTGTGQPLTVAKIRRKSRSHKNLFENDVIVSINDQSCAGLSYDEAMNIVDEGGSTLLIKINRTAKGKENVAPQTTESGNKSPVVIRNESEHTKVQNDGHTYETISRRSEQINQSKQQSQLRVETASPQPSKPFPDHTESHQPIIQSRTQSPPCNHDFSPQISPPLPRQPDSSLHKPLSSYSSSTTLNNSVVDTTKSHSESFSQKTQLTYTQMHQQQRQHASVQQLTSHQTAYMEPNIQIQRHEFPSHVEPQGHSQIQRHESQYHAQSQGHSQIQRPFASQIHAEPQGQTEIQRHVSHIHADSQGHSQIQRQEFEQPAYRPEHSYSQSLRQYDSEVKQETRSGQPDSQVSATQVFTERNIISKPNFQEHSLQPNRLLCQQPSETLSKLQPTISVTETLSVSTQPFYSYSTESPLSATEHLWTPDSSLGVGHTWRPSGSFMTQETTRTEFRESRQEVKKRVPPPTMPKPKQRPISAPPMDIDIFKAFHSETPLVGMYDKPTDVMKVKGFPANIFLPPEEEEMDTSLFTRRRKMYSSSSFYEEAGSIYPTVEEQVELCRKIADSLSADTNKKSKGANMFFKRVKRSHKWIHEAGPGSDGFTSDSDYDSSSTPDPSKMQYITVSKGPPKLKLIMAPRPVQDMVKLRTLGERFNEHTAVSPDICYNLVRDLNSPCGKGAAMFTKRKQKAEDWVVDEEKVKNKLAQLAADLPPPKTQDLTWNARLRLIKSPWDAALESPIGSCDAAFSEMTSGDRIDAFASSLIRAAENKIRANPNGPPPPLLATLANDLCMPKAPKGWMGTTTTENFPNLDVSITSDSYDPVAARLDYEPTVTPHSMVFHDFNTRPRSWSPGGAFGRGNFRSVRPPTH